MNPIQGLQAFDPSTDPLGIGLQQQAQARRAAMAPPAFNNSLPDPQWDGYFQALNNAGVNNIKSAPDLSTDPGMASAAAPPWGLGGTGPSAAMMNPPGILGPNRLTEPSAPINGLQAAKPMKKSTIQPLAGR